MDRWDVFIILAAGYVAVMTLVRLMARRRNQVLEQVREQIEAQRPKKKKKAEEPDNKNRGAA
jgi:hypothetical protein